MKNSSIAAAALFLFVSLTASGANGLYEGFASPPRAAAPHVWWHWMNGNITKEGITADLEAMKDIGLAGAQSFDCGCGIPFGGVKFASDEFFSMIRHAHDEAKRLGLELCLANCSGYSSSGGPWVTSEDSMKEVVVSETIVSGGRKPALPVKGDTNGFYRDIAVVAFPLPKGASCDTQDVKPVVTFSPETFTETYLFELPEAREVSELKCVFRAKGILWGDAGDTEIVLSTSDDGSNWREHFRCKDNATPGYTVSFVPHYHHFKRTKARHFKVTFRFKARWCWKTAQLTDVHLGNFYRLPMFGNKLLFVARSVGDSADASFDSSKAIARGSVKVIDPRFDSSGNLDWIPPEGDWVVQRVGYCCSGRHCAPASDYGHGLEVDKLDADALDRFFDAYVAKLAKICGIDPASKPEGRAGFNAVLVDSWEVGSQNWTHGLEKKFEKRFGYSMLGFLPCFNGYVVGSIEETNRFSADFRRLIEELFAANYADRLAERCRKAGLMLSIEPYSSQPCSSLRYGRNVDLPMTEFWCQPQKEPVAGGTCKYISSLCHVRGRRYIGAESFTTHPGDAGWQQSPRHYKAFGDIAYTHGVNRIIYHRFAHQPWTGEYAKPGMTMGPWGTHFERTLTWWNYAHDWVRYQTRCQYMLQEGRFAADILYYVGSKVPTDAMRSVREGDRPSIKSHVPRGYDYDFIGEDSLPDLVITAEGRIRTPGGTEYAVLAVPDGEEVPGFKGPVVRHSGIARYLADKGIKPMFETSDEKLAWIQRDYPDGSQAWFVCSVDTDNERTADVVLRDSGRFAPQIWDAESGKRSLAQRWTRLPDGRAKVSISLPPSGSCFIVFTPDTKGVKAEAPSKVFSRVQVAGPWKVSFKEPRRGAPESIKLDSLVDLSRHEDPRVRYFSGSCVYSTSINVDQADVSLCTKAVLDLGFVGEMARVKVNGVTAPLVAWKKPYTVDVTRGVKLGGGRIDIEIDAVNTWVNRIIGDIIEDRPMDWKWKGVMIAGIPDFVKKGEPSPNGRHTFYTYRYYYKSSKDKIPVSGVTGPVELRLFR